MINTRNNIVSELYKYIQKPIIPNTDIKDRPPYPYVDYAITTVTNDSGDGNHSMQDGEVELINQLDLQKKISFSFNIYSDNEVECYNLAKKVWDWFKHIGEADIVVVDILEIRNRSLLEINQYEYRYGFDLFIRYDESIKKEQLIILDYKIIGEIIKE